MSFNYVGARAEAKAIIELYGQPSTVIKKGVTGGKDEWGDPIPDEPDIVIDGIITPFLRAKSSEIDDTTVLMGDGFVFFHSDTAPEVDMQTTLNGVTYRIVAISNLMALTMLMFIESYS